MDERKTSRKGRSKDRDGVYKRRGLWHFEYKDPQTGQWHSKTTGTTAYNDAKEFKRQFLGALTGRYDPGNDRLKFAEAADSYIQYREAAVAAGTVRLEKERLRALKKLLAQLAGPDLKMKDIGIQLVRNYQQKRIAEGVGPRTVNMEGQLLRSILKHHEQWKLDGKYEPLREPISETGRSLTPEEEVRLLDTARSRPEWSVVYHTTVLENETGMRGVEVRNLQLKRIDLAAGEIHLLRSKNRSGVRTISLSVDAVESVKELLVRASVLGADHPDHYLLPALVTQVSESDEGVLKRIRRYDPTKPTKGWRTAWRKLTASAGIPGLRSHDLRHNWITSHAEIGTPQSVLEAQSGHLSKRMSDHYKHISERAARKASDALTHARTEQRAQARAKLEQKSLPEANEPLDSPNTSKMEGPLVTH